MGQCRSAEFYDQGTILRSNTNSRNRFTDSLHQLQIQKLHHLYKFHLQVELEPCSALNALLIQPCVQRSADSIHICEE
jgi:hypothetical protein